MGSAPDVCRHCSSPVPANRTDGFCCSGCSYVFDLLHEQGLDQFYDLKGSQSLPPVPPQAMRERDYQWLEDLVAATPESELTLSMQGLSCVGCVWLIEKLFSRHNGALRINVDVVRGDVRFSWQKGEFSPVAFARDLQAFGYLLGPPRTGEEQEKQSSGLERRMGLCGAFAMNAMAFSLPAYFGMPRDFMFAKWFDLIAAASATLALLVGGSYFAERAWRSLRMGALHIDTPIALGIIAAYLGSLGGWIAGVDGLKYFDFVAIFTFLMLAGRWAQQAAVERNRRKLMRDSSVPDSVTVLADDGSEKSKPVSALKSGDHFSIKSGQAIPVAARLLSARAAVSLEWINGESEAQARDEGQLLPAGALNIGTSEIEAAALETWEQSTLRKLLEARKPGENRDLWLERLLRGYLAIVIVVGIGGALWWWAQGAGVAQALQVMISVFVVSCPCALGVAAPLADDLAVSRAEKLGVFVRTLGLWKKLARLKKAVFDKTGTLTLENPVLLNPDALRVLDDESRSALRHLISGNLHPVSRSLFDALGRGTQEMTGEVVEEIGFGLNFTDDRGRVWSLGRPQQQSKVREQAANVTLTPALSPRERETKALLRQGECMHLESERQIVQLPLPRGEGWGEGVDSDCSPTNSPSIDTEFSCDGVPLAGFSFRDQMRGESVAEVKSLREQRGIDVFVLSGDREGKVAELAAQLHLPRSNWLSSMTPEQKAEWVKAHNQDDTLYIGDGANDSLAFDAALCAGSPVTGRSFLEHKADFYFLGHSMSFVGGMLDVARQHRKAVHRVFAFSVTYNIVTAVVGLLGHLNPLAAAILMPLSSVATLSIVAFTFRKGKVRAKMAKSMSDPVPSAPLPQPHLL